MFAEIRAGEEVVCQKSNACEQGSLLAAPQ